MFEQIKSKLVGEARDIVITSSFNKWTDIKEALLNKFGDPRSEELLLNDLVTCYQLHSETYEQYHEKIKSKLQVLLEHVSIKVTNDSVKVSKQLTYTTQALTTFVSGILEPYCSHLMNCHVNSLQQALYECRKLDNNKAQVSFMNFMRNRGRPNNHGNNNNKTMRNNHPNPRPQQPSSHIYQAFSPPLRANQPFAAIPNFNVPKPQVQMHTTQQSPFPRGPINIQSRPVQQRFPTNSEVFGKPKQTQPLPTPMSISTRNSHRPQGQSFFTPRSRPTFVSQELFNTETHEEDPVDYPTGPMLEEYYYQEEQYDHQEEEVEDPQNFRSPTQQTENT